MAFVIYKIIVQFNFKFLFKYNVKNIENLQE